MTTTDDHELWEAAGLTEKQIEAMEQLELGRGARVGARSLSITRASYKDRLDHALHKLEMYRAKQPVV